ncbi:phosphoenolpyruvate carboxylase [Aureococcus anophagefferens]|uniref:phosphoenolpyruvate carboxylase n=1 Tax=Aureococcus anophagefferens TaxID=44056 RepID=A0ABR1FPQ3_AURAN
MLGLRSALRSTARGAALVSPPRSLSTLPSSFEEMERLDPGGAAYARSVKKLGKLLGAQMVQHGDAAQVAVVERLRHQARRWRDALHAGAENEAADRFATMAAEVATLKPAALRDVARAFAHFLALSNAAEQDQRVRHLATQRLGGSALFPEKRDSCAGVVAGLLDEGVAPAAVVDALLAQKTEIVLTAHPTEVHRRTLLAKHRRVAELLCQLDAFPAGSYEVEQLETELRGVVSALWGSDELRREKPSPQKEARGGLAVVETSLWEAVPAFLRKLDATLAQHGGALPLDASPVALASWMGGDRDGNPNVDAAVTRSVVAAQRRKGASLLIVELDALRLDLSVTGASDAVLALAKTFAGDEPVREPYKAVCDGFIGRLRATIRWADGALDEAEWPTASRNSLASRVGRTAKVDPPATEPLFDATELAAALRAMHASLEAQGYGELASGRLVDAIRRVNAFGLQLCPLDVRQESTRHANAVDALRAFAGVGARGSYAALDDDAKIAWLSDELETGRPLLRRGDFEKLVDGDFVEDAVDRDVLKTCAYVAEAPPDTFGAYVISQATSAADVLAVELLLHEAGAASDRSNCTRVVPLFETLDDLNNGPASLRRLFSSPGYLDRCGRKQEIMVGYSDSAKDAGRLAAWWAQYEGQEKMLAVCDEFGVEATFFHGKGGTVGRGGNPETYRAILAHPPNTIDGRFRVTEQGEMIAFNFGEPRVAERTLDIFSAAVLRDKLGDASDRAVKPEWRATMAKLSETSCAAYRALVREDADFVPYFRKATPELELAALNVGSRPAKRNPKGGVESLRAIPWIFAWTQTRLGLPAWLGIGDGFAAADGAELRAMYEEWPWFKTNVDLIETLLAKLEPEIAKHYDAVLVGGGEPRLAALGERLRGALANTTDEVLAVSGRGAPAEGNELLMRALKLRNPYVDVLNVLQVECLRRIRAADDGEAKDDDALDLDDALLICINGIAAGMQKSG